MRLQSFRAQATSLVGNDLKERGQLGELGRCGLAARLEPLDAVAVVGWSNVNGSATELFLYSNGKMVDLNTLIPTDTGLTLGSVVGINNASRPRSSTGA